MHLLFVCTGNTCRSPLAEGIARAMIARRHVPDLLVHSAGTSAWPGSPASDGSLLVALEHDIDLSGHRAQSLTSPLISASDVILTMGPSHLEHAEAMGGQGRSWMLRAFVDEAQARPISDPFGGDLEVYRATYTELESLIGAVLDRIVRERADRSTPADG
jgi:protein-tyrosine-phosphatase